jgi:hypothetical protein
MLLNRYVTVCSIIRANRGIPCDLEGQSAFWMKGDAMVQVQRDKRLVQIISMIHEVVTIVNRAGIQENKHGNKEALCCSPVQ